MQNGWVKIYRTLLTDQKVLRLSPSKRYIFVAYILIAKHSPRWRGYLVDEAGDPLSIRERARVIGVDFSWISRCDKEFVTLGLLEAHPNNRLKIKHYDRYQCNLSGVEYTQQSVDYTQQSVDYTQQIRSKPESQEVEEGTEEYKKKSVVPKSEQNGWRTLAIMFRKHWPSEKQGPVSTTERQLREEYEESPGMVEIHRRLTEHIKAATKNLKPWNIIQSGAGNNGNGQRPTGIHREVTELQFKAKHGHFPEDIEASRSCKVCAGTNSQPKKN